MTSPTQAHSLSTDPVMREAEIKAMRDDIDAMHRRARIIGRNYPSCRGHATSDRD